MGLPNVTIWLSRKRKIGRWDETFLTPVLGVVGSILGQFP